MITDKHLVCFQNAIDHAHAAYKNTITNVMQPCADRWLVTFTSSREADESDNRTASYVRCALFTDEPGRCISKTNDIIIK